MIPLNSSDMSGYVVPPGTIFDEGETVNEFEEDGTREEGKRRIVPGTMEIGLLRRSGNVVKAGSGSIAGSGGA